MCLKYFRHFKCLKCIHFLCLKYGYLFLNSGILKCQRNIHLIHLLCLKSFLRRLCVCEFQTFHFIVFTRKNTSFIGFREKINESTTLNYPKYSDLFNKKYLTGNITEMKHVCNKKKSENGNTIFFFI